MIIAPSLLSADFLNLESELARINQAHNCWLHLDIMDGHFVPNLTFGSPLIEKIKRVTSLPLDAHFMVTNPELYLDLAKSWGLHNFTFHWEAIHHHDRFISEAKKIFPSVGISINPSTSINVIPEYILQKIDLILIMTVNPGFGGQSFIESMVDKIKMLYEIKTKHRLPFHIQVDGGISDTNASLLKKAGATNLVAGSYIFSAPNKDYLHRIERLRNS